MTSSDDRREVAKRLRGEEIARNSEDAYVVLLSCIGIRPQLPAMRTYKDAMARMADLIDPTCHIADDDWASQQCMGPMLSCDRCGNAFPEINGPYQYCPCCGARVVDE